MRPSAQRHRMSTSDGFTLIEVLVVMVVFGILAALSTSGWVSYARAHELRGGVDQLTAVMRNAQERALAEASTYCITFAADNRSYTVTKFGCGAAGTQQGPVEMTPSARVTFTAAAFTQPDGTVSRSVQFTPRGSATPGSVTLGRQGSRKTTTISVEGLTGRVSVG